VRLNGDRVLPADVALYKRRFPRDCQLCLDIASTETRAYASWLVDHDTPIERPLVPVGYPRPDLHVALIDDDGEAVPAGEIGEVVVTSAGLSIGYWRDEALTRDRFRPSAARPGMREYRTGDFARLLPDGLLEFVGRRDRQVKIRGNTVHLGEVEAVAATCPAIAEIAMVARKLPDGIRLIAYCVARGGDAAAVIRAWCREQLPPPMRPSDIILVDALPRLAGGKVDLVALERIDAERAGAAPIAIVESPAIDRGAAAAAVEQAWRKLLGADTLRESLSFEEAGGDSLLALRMLLTIERALGIDLPIETIDWETRPSDLIERIARVEPGVLPGATGADAAPTIFLFPGIFGLDFDTMGFVRRLGDDFRIVSIDYRSGEQGMFAMGDGESWLRQFEEKVAAAGYPRRLWVIGYSYGCRLAAEAARRLIARGVAVEYVGLIDGATYPAILARNQRRVEQGTSRPDLARRLKMHGGIGGYIVERPVEWVVRRLLPRHRFRESGMLIAALSRLRLRGAARHATKTVLQVTRANAFKALPAAPLPAPVSLFISTAPDSESRHTPDLGWGDFAERLEIFPLQGDHDEIINGPGSDELLRILAATERQLRHREAA
jgi:thioesterase domain-containing protein/acyl carrier protein